MISPPTRITDRFVHHYANELVVELTGVDDDGVIVVLSYQFEFVDGRERVQPKSDVDSRYATAVRDCLETHGYTWSERPGS